jgi:hypothetical protein
MRSLVIVDLAIGSLLQQALAAQPAETEVRPARGEFFVLTDAEVVVAGGVDVQFGGDAGALQGEVHDHAVLGVADLVVG